MASRHRNRDMMKKSIGKQGKLLKDRYKVQLLKKDIGFNDKVNLKGDILWKL